MKHIVLTLLLLIFCARMALGQWSFKVMSERREYVSSAQFNNEVLFVGGYQGSSFLDNIDVLDLTTMTWKPVITMPSAEARWLW